MADLESVKVSDTLLIPVKVIRVDSAYGAPVKVAFETVEFWIDRDTAQAAEHIPAPRPAFKRRDLVRQISGRGYQEPYRKGIVLIPEGTRPMMPHFVNVHWPHGETSNEDPRNLEHDEAPE